MSADEEVDAVELLEDAVPDAGLGVYFLDGPGSLGGVLLVGDEGLVESLSFCVEVVGEDGVLSDEVDVVGRDVVEVDEAEALDSDVGVHLYFFIKIMHHSNVADSSYSLA